MISCERLWGERFEDVVFALNEKNVDIQRLG